MGDRCLDNFSLTLITRTSYRLGVRVRQSIVLKLFASRPGSRQWFGRPFSLIRPWLRRIVNT